jgi:hypothetical protein
MTGCVALSGRLPRFGYTDRQAAFLRLVALHSGYFVARQYDQFIGGVPGGSRCRLLDQLHAKGHVTELPSCDNTTIYHLSARRLYANLGIENSRNRRAHEPFVMKTRLMTLDFVLSHPEVQFMTTERERVALFADVLKLPRTVLPAKFYSSKSGANKTVRYFVDRNPVFLSPAAEGGAPVVSFACIDASNETTAGFRTYLAQYRGLLGALDKFRLIYVAKEAERFEQAGKEFARILAPEESVERLRSVDPNRLIDHFLARMCHERRDYQGFDTAKIQRLAMELKEFKGPAFDSLFEMFRSQGSAPILAELSRFKSAKAQPEGTFETQFLPYSYAFLGAV